MNRRQVLLGVALILLIVFVYSGSVRLLLRPYVDLHDFVGGRDGQTRILALFSLLHATYVLGWRHALAFFGISAVVSWIFEQVGVLTGAVYGPYHYTGVLGLKLGEVPLLIPLAWFMMIWPSFVIANLIAGGRPTSPPGGLGRLVWVAFLSAMVMTAWDLVIDPVLSGPAVKAWIWEQGGAYFDIPPQNYAGWLLTTFTVYVLYRLLERRTAIRPIGAATAAVAAMPLVAYLSMMVSNVLAGGPPALQVIGPFVMGVPLAAAATRLRD